MIQWVATAGTGIFAAIFLFTGIGAFWFAARSWGLHRRMNAPRQPIGGIQPGVARVRGRAEGLTPLLSPLTQTPCFYFWVSVQKWAMMGRGPDFRMVHNQYAQQTFTLEDGTGRITVNPERAEFDIPLTVAAQVSRKGEGKIYFDASLAKHKPTAREFYTYLEANPPDPGEALTRMVGLPEPAAPDMRDALEPQSGPFWSYNALGPNLGCRFEERCVVAGQEYEVLGTVIDDPALGRTLTRTYITSKSETAEKSTLALRAGIAFVLGIVFCAAAVFAVFAAITFGTVFRAVFK